MLNLIFKDFKLLFSSDQGKGQKILSLLFSGIFIVLFVAIEVFIFNMIFQKINIIQYADKAFVTVFLVIVSTIMIIMGVGRANKLFFDERDINQLIRCPVTSSEIIFSKIVFLFIMHYTTSFVFIYPIFVSYGVLVGRTPWYYFITVFYPVLTFFFEVGISLIFVYPYKLVKDFLKKHIIVELVTSVILMIVLLYAYSFVLNIFMELVANNSMSSLFTTDNINWLISLRKYLVPINFIIDLFIEYEFRNIVIMLAISLGAFIIGVSVCIFGYKYFRNATHSTTKDKKEKKTKIVSIPKALIKKELTLIFKDPNYIFAFSGILFSMPFFMYLVISAINKIFTNGVFLTYTSTIPGFLPFTNILLIMMFTVIVNSGANKYISMESKTIRIIKSIPVSHRLQLLIKVLIPFILSSISLLISLFVLVTTGIINFLTFVIALIFSFILLAIFCMVSLIEELNIRNNKAKQTFLSTMVSYVLPISFFIVSMLISILFKVLNMVFADNNIAFKIPDALSYILPYALGLIGLLLVAGIIVLYLIKNLDRKFMELDVIN